MQASEAPATIRLVVNGATASVPLEPDRMLIGVLRDELGITGPKPGCGEGVCGACTVLLDGRPIRSCRTPLSEARTGELLTIEGLAPAGGLHPVQRAFLEAGAFQCGYCTPGMVLSTVALLADAPHPDDAAVRRGLEGNVCRCGTYARIREAVLAADELTGADPDADDDDQRKPVEVEAGGPIDLRRPTVPWDLTEPSARDSFEVLPDGLVVVTQPDVSGGWSTTSDAWLHVGAEGVVTAFTGKVDGGQDNRTGLTVIVAEALGVPVDRVWLVMGDTDLCPHDQGTFGSRSTPDAGRELRVVGLAARRLLDEASGGLVRAQRRVEIIAPGDRLTVGAGGVQPPRSGVRQVRGRSIVTGAKRFPSDVARPRMRHAAILRPPASGAELLSVDVPSAWDAGATLVREGSFIAIVAATEAEARAALGRVQAEWTLPDAPAAADLESHLRAHPKAEEGWEGHVDRSTGDVEGGLRAAPIRLDATYRTAYLAHVPLETRVAVAEWDDEGRVTVWTGTQVPFGARARVAAALGIAEASVRVIVPDFGGGFGGKHAGEVAVEAARLARAVKAPVKVRWSREEEFRDAYFRPAAVIDVRAGAGRDGRLTAWEMRNLNSGPFGLEGPYDVPNTRVQYQPAESPLPQGSYRALAATANHFARESAMDELATSLEIDPLDFRLAHLDDERLAAAFRAAADRIGWTREREPGVGLGIAGGVEKDARVATAVEIRVGPDGRPMLGRIVSAFDCGRIVNPDALANQVQGAMSMGLGGALFESVEFEAGGVLTNASMTDYRLPRITDIPPIEVILLDRPDIPSAGAGETPIVALAPAIANAIFDAAGIRLRSLPLIPEGRIPSPTA